MISHGRRFGPGTAVLLFLLLVTVVGCSKEDRASAKLAALEEAYVESELGLGERFAEFTLQYDALAERYRGTPAALEAEKWLMTGTSAAEEETATAALAGLEKEYEESELQRAERTAAFTPRYEELAAEFWGTGAALEAKRWLMTTARRAATVEERDAVVSDYADAVFERYARSSHLEKLGEWATYFNEEQVAEYFVRMREDSPHPGVRASGILEAAKRMRSLMRRGQVEDPVGLADRLDADLQLLIDEYAEVPRKGSTYGIMADALLNAHTEDELAIGQPAPEILGVTAGGEEIRLSEFRGKVVVIDFWGDW